MSFRVSGLGLWPRWLLNRCLIANSSRNISIFTFCPLSVTDTDRVQTPNVCYTKQGMNDIKYCMSSKISDQKICTKIVNKHFPSNQKCSIKICHRKFPTKKIVSFMSFDDELAQYTSSSFSSRYIIRMNVISNCDFMIGNINHPLPGFEQGPGKGHC